MTWASSHGGENYGWNRMEGNHCYPSGSNCDRNGLALPVHEYGTHGAGNCSIIGGFVYQGSSYPALIGGYVYGDLCSGKIWVLAPKPDGSWSNTEMLDTSLQISSFGEDDAGELYMTAMDGGVYRVTATPKVARTAGGNCSVCHVPSRRIEDDGAMVALARRLARHP